MTKIKCMIVDDEALARKGLEGYIKELDFLQLKGICKNAMEANSLINRENIDVIFLDIEMPMISGMELLKSLRNAPKVIFTTAYAEYALDSFEFDVIDYLVKPISFERFMHAANKAYRILAKEQNQLIVSPKEEHKEEFVFVKTEQKLVKLLLKDIRYVKSLQNYIQIFTEKGTLTTLIPLKKFLELLSSDDFLQIHKSVAISKSRVDAIVGNMVVIGEEKLPISRSLKEFVMDQLLKDRVLKK